MEENTVTTHRLTSQERCLLQRYFDESNDLDVDPSQFDASEDEALAELLLRDDAIAYLDELDQLSQGVQLAFESPAATPPRRIDVAAIFASKPPSEAPLPELAPLLERSFDQETDAVEEEFVSKLKTERDDVARYLQELGGLQNLVNLGFKSYDAMPEISIADGFFDRMRERQNEERQAMALFDGEEINGSDSAVDVESLKKSPAYSVFSTSQKLAQLGFSEVDQKQDFESLQHRVLAKVKGAANDDANNQPANDNFFHKYRQGLLGALAATLLFGIAGLVVTLVQGEKKTIINRTVVVVEDVKYGPGLGGEVVNPIRQVAANPPADGTDGNEDPTVIWVYDESDDAHAKNDETQKDNAKEEGVDGQKEGQDEEEKNYRGLSI